MPLIRKTGVPQAAATSDLATVTAALKDGTPDQRWAAARSAHALPGSAALLAEALWREQNPRVREAMFTSLARIATPESVELLLPFVRSDEAHLRTGALDALQGMKEAAWFCVPRLLGDSDSDVRVLACELVRGMPAEDASRLLCGLLDAEPEPNVCAAAVEVLAEIGGPEALPALERCGERLRATPFLAFSIQLATERIRSQSTQSSA